MVFKGIVGSIKERKERALHLGDKISFSFK